MISVKQSVVEEIDVEPSVQNERDNLLLSEVDEVSFTLDDQEEENKRLLLQRESRKLLTHEDYGFLNKDKRYRCIITYDGASLSVDTCNQDYVARRGINNLMDEVDLKSRFAKANFTTKEQISISVGSHYF
ncbi:hypothetical protein VCHA53O466_40135 [Vibrio chagasii]|nr:hypothetical protein VCHA53O466_40135 [Vibrio chagasii]